MIIELQSCVNDCLFAQSPGKSANQTCGGLVRELAGNRVTHSGVENYVRVAGNPSEVDAKRGDHFLQADLSLPIGPTWITSGLATVRESKPLCYSVAANDIGATPEPTGAGARRSSSQSARMCIQKSAGT